MNFDSNRCDDTVVLRNPKIAKQQQKQATKTHISDEALKQAKIDQETEELKHKTVSQDISRLIIQGRNTKKMNQKQLAQALAVQASVIQDYENGKAIPNNQLLGKLERVLGVKLRGKISK